MGSTLEADAWWRRNSTPREKAIARQIGGHELTDHEKKLLQACYDGLKGNISKGVEFAQNPPAK